MSTTVSISSNQVIQSTAPFSPVKSRGLQETKYLYVQPLARGASSTTFFLGWTLFSLDECLSSSFLGLDGVEGGLL
ncbi:hypothetical protein HanRHA438_Chr10g0431911 [Helianthus annuus]|nr:hypothetical protein HanRHA438_Chr10g0431911 [Helianthus annuus]